jgi:hypothetical protein
MYNKHFRNSGLCVVHNNREPLPVCELVRIGGASQCGDFLFDEKY